MVWIFKTYSVLVSSVGNRLSRPPPTPRGRATAPLLRHTAALGVTGQRRGAASELGERGAWKGAPPGMACSVPGKGGDPCREGRGFHNLRRHFPPVFFSCPRFWVSICMEGVFSGDRTLSSPPPGIYCRLIPEMAVGHNNINPSTIQQQTYSLLLYVPYCCTWWVGYARVGVGRLVSIYRSRWRSFLVYWRCSITLLTATVNISNRHL